PDGVTPVPNSYVRIVSGTDGPDGLFQRYALTEAHGRYSQSGLPAGSITVVPYAAPMGIAQGTLPANGTIDITVIQGTAVAACPQTLTGADGFVYDASCSGALSHGGTADGRLQHAYNVTGYALRVNGADVTTVAAAQTEMGGRQLLYGPSPLAGVSVS